MVQGGAMARGDKGTVSGDRRITEMSRDGGMMEIGGDGAWRWGQDNESTMVRAPKSLGGEGWRRGAIEGGELGKEGQR
ncbi:hypothetical protein GUJ93_ZPchr0005g14996 [Zizania palustris]|uniref:Uncharacterized protein n=1 Tax=Zizania palustris TaxID=103762 RepID=A0A8J5VG11_ZIZPA|nr:hypothetical protein GUJ93_ZPchr0005g14996 [Zizania palustris]